MPWKRLIAIAVTLFCLLEACTTVNQDNRQFNFIGASRIKLIQLSDLHYDGDIDTLERIADIVNGIQPDIVVFTGDTINDYSRIDEFLAFIGEIASVKHIYAVFGNWDYKPGKDIQDYIDSLQGTGVHVLINQTDTIDIRDVKIRIYGLDDYLYGSPSYDGFVPLVDGINIVLGHCPILFDRLNDYLSDNDSEVLMLCGHTHGGQVTFLGIPLILPTGSGRYVSGTYKDGARTLYVSKGIGYSHIKIRLFASPSIEVLQLD